MPKANFLDVAVDDVDAGAGVGAGEPTPTSVVNIHAIKCDPATDVRVGPTDPGEPERIRELAESIRANGLAQPLVVRPDGKGDWLLVAGRRRLAALQTLYAEEPRYGSIPVYVRSDITTDEAARRLARHENTKRKNFSALELALNIKAVRREHGWTTGAGTKDVARYFGVSPAEITQHEKILTLPDELQAQVHMGVLSAEAAFTLAKARPDARRAVVARAGEIARAERKSKEEVANGRVRVVPDARGGRAGGGRASGDREDSRSERTESNSGTRIAARHVAKAARELAAVPVGKEKQRSRAELVEFFEQVAAGRYPSVMTRFARCFVVQFARGRTGAEKTLWDFWNAIAERIAVDGEKKKRSDVPRARARAIKKASRKAKATARSVGK